MNDIVVNHLQWSIPHWTIYVVIAGWIAIPALLWFLTRNGKTLLALAAVTLLMCSSTFAQGVKNGGHLQPQGFWNAAGDWCAGAWGYMCDVWWGATFLDF
jgi:hypothetical protein